LPFAKSKHGLPVKSEVYGAGLLKAEETHDSGPVADGCAVENESRGCGAAEGAENGTDGGSDPIAAAGNT